MFCSGSGGSGDGFDEGQDRSGSDQGDAIFALLKTDDPARAEQWLRDMLHDLHGTERVFKVLGEHYLESLDPDHPRTKRKRVQLQEQIRFLGELKQGLLKPLIQSAGEQRAARQKASADGQPHADSE